MHNAIIVVFGVL